jgi:hypothetical protein
MLVLVHFYGKIALPEGTKSEATNENGHSMKFLYIAEKSDDSEDSP